MNPMKEVERWRESVSRIPAPDVLEKRREEGWRIAAIEWERERGDKAPVEGRPIPYGLRISADCRQLEIDPGEKAVVALIIAMIAGDHPLSRIASELNQKGFRTRSGSEWTQLRIFQMLPRVIELGPEILSAHEWPENKKRLLQAVS